MVVIYSYHLPEETEQDFLTIRKSSGQAIPASPRPLSRCSRLAG